MRFAASLRASRNFATVCAPSGASSTSRFRAMTASGVFQLAVVQDGARSFCLHKGHQRLEGAGRIRSARSGASGGVPIWRISCRFRKSGAAPSCWRSCASRKPMMVALETAMSFPLRSARVCALDLGETTS